MYELPNELRNEFKKSRHFKEISGKLGIDSKSSGHPKTKFRQLC